MKSKRIIPIVSLEEARQNIRHYLTELARNEILRNRIGYVRAWYAERTDEGWIFAPSKFTGYRFSSAADYLAESGNRGQRDGRETERVLAKWYKGVEPDTQLGRELRDALNRFVAGFGQTSNALARINRPKEMPIDENGRGNWSAEQRDELLNRISVDRNICGGRPCIRGTRMRVVDVIEALAHGTTREELLRDFDYLTADDITAALLYAAHASDHRVVHAA